MNCAVWFGLGWVVAVYVAFALHAPGWVHVLLLSLLVVVMGVDLWRLHRK